MLRRLARRREVPKGEFPPSVARVLRLSMARAAETAMGLSLAVLGVGEELLELEPALDTLGEDWLLIGLCGPDGMISGLAGLDAESRAAVVEMQTLGALRARPAEPRPITATDAALAMPLIDGLIADLVETAGETPLNGWADGASCLRRLSGAQAARLVLPEGLYRLARLTLDFGGEGRQGALFLMLPAEGREAAGQHDSGPEWNATLRSAVLSAPAVLTAVLHRMRLTYADVAAFEVGQVLPLPGVTVGSVRLEGADGRLHARARLGQASGLRAVRVEEPAPAELQDAPMAGARAAPASLASGLAPPPGGAFPAAPGGLPGLGGGGDLPGDGLGGLPPLPTADGPGLAPLPAAGEPGFAPAPMSVSGLGGEEEEG
ncbi:FliM/FliN family flagellar motor switch protein [Pseudoroseicyclus tamaricis]|uniref:Flagellar motor switch protein FliN-like C-terminal domain-containing protein n=1 Tax=Pseudoroseicyclus tamaricis TaxID=2705421 RepID=A0A6B2JW89_9RHOB|nr:FliM/FliN family flagellar motor switch protein [Pseudoroseicyclus tamaricis]NDV00919.1 hypothetical protein [Pseudoroseicyclus tamaricis]